MENTTLPKQEPRILGPMASIKMLRYLMRTHSRVTDPVTTPQMRAVLAILSNSVGSSKNAQLFAMRGLWGPILQEFGISINHRNQMSWGIASVFIDYANSLQEKLVKEVVDYAAERQARTELKLRLFESRRRLFGIRSYCVCPICGKSIINAPDMHEVVSRKDVQNSNAQWDIFCAENCVLLHQACHQYARSDENVRKILFSLVQLEGKEKILLFYDKLEKKNKVQIPTITQARSIIGEMP